jgi:hypothetical protein
VGAHAATSSRGHHAVLLRSDLFGGCAVILYVTIAGWLALKLRLPLRVARWLFVFITVVLSYFISDAVVPEYNRPEWVWVMTIVLPIAPVCIGWEFIADDYRRRDLDERCARENRQREDGGQD